jgi:flagellar secretion chaperone FliS
MSYGLAHARYASDATATVPAGRLLTMLYDRLVQNLSVAEKALRIGDVATTGDRLGQAQEILLELHSTLDVSVWPEGEALGRIYLWIVGELSQARLRNQPQRIADCRELVEPLRDAWHEAARAVTPATGTASFGIGGAA